MTQIERRVQGLTEEVTILALLGYWGPQLEDRKAQLEAACQQMNKSGAA